MNEINLIFNNRNMNDLFFVKAVRGRGIVGYEVEETEKNRADGSFYRYKKRPPRILEVDITIYGNSPNHLREKIDEINGILKTKEEVPIAFTDEPDITYYGTLSETSQDDETVSISNETLTFYCSNPDKIGLEGQVIETSQQIDVIVEGTARTPPIITAIVQETTSQIKFEIRNKILILHYNFKENDVIKIDCIKEKVYINGSLQMTTIDLLYADFFHLDTGLNTITIDPIMRLDISYNERWL